MKHFATTRWSLVLDAGTRLTPRGHDALATLCELYWYPLYSYLRRRGHSAEDARILRKVSSRAFSRSHALNVVDPTRGRFRFVPARFARSLRPNERDRDRAQKRGGGTAPISLDVAIAEDRYCREPAAPLTPRTHLDRNWALAVLERVLNRPARRSLTSRARPILSRAEGLPHGRTTDGSYHDVGATLDE